MKKKIGFVKKLMAVGMAAAVASMSIGATVTEAHSEPHYGPVAFGSDWTDDTFYLWHKVPTSFNAQDHTQSLTDFLKQEKYQVKASTDLKSDSMFRLMIMSNGVYYEADWTRMEEGCWNYAECRPLSENREIQADQDLFITKGAEKSFMCFDLGDNSYRLYYSDSTDEAVQNSDDGYTKDVYNGLRLTYVQNWYHDDIIICGSDGEPWGHDDSDWNDSDAKRGAYSVSTDVWSFYKDSDGEFRIFPWGNGVDDNRDLRCATGIFYGFEYSFTDCTFWGNYDRTWTLFVGEPITIDTAINEDNLTTSEQIVSTPMYIKKDDTFTVDKGATLYVNDVMFLDGKIVNKGTVVIGAKGAIISYNDDLGTIECTRDGDKDSGGDIVVQKNGILAINTINCDRGNIVVDGVMRYKNCNLDNESTFETKDGFTFVCDDGFNDTLIRQSLIKTYMDEGVLELKPLTNDEAETCDFKNRAVTYEQSFILSFLKVFLPKNYDAYLDSLYSAHIYEYETSGVGEFTRHSVTNAYK